MKEVLSERAVAAALSTRWMGRSYHYLQSTGSTNDLLKKQVERGGSEAPPAGTVILTDHQKQGRGRFDRIWEAPPYTSLLFSVLLRPNWPATQLSWLSMLAGLSVAEAIEKETDLSVSLKWPNDVVLAQNGYWAKVCGILLEGALLTSEQLEHAVLGIGVNVNIPMQELPPAAQPATSLLVSSGRPVSRLSLLGEILERLEGYFEAADRGESPQRRWNDRLVTLGQRVEVHFASRELTLEGTAEETDEWGQLMVRDEQGKLHTIMAADVTLRGDT